MQIVGLVHARWVGGDLTAKADISAKYFAIGVDNFNACQELAALLAKTKLPAEFQAAWRVRHAYEIIELRLQYDIAAEAKRLAVIPLESAKLVKADELPAGLAKNQLDWLAEINPGLESGGSYVVAGKDVKETAPHVVTRVLVPAQSRHAGPDPGRFARRADCNSGDIREVAGQRGLPADGDVEERRAVASLCGGGRFPGS